MCQLLLEKGVALKSPRVEDAKKASQTVKSHALSLEAKTAESQQNNQNQEKTCKHEKKCHRKNKKYGSESGRTNAGEGKGECSGANAESSGKERRSRRSGHGGNGEVSRRGHSGNGEEGHGAYGAHREEGQGAYGGNEEHHSQEGRECGEEEFATEGEETEQPQGEEEMECEEPVCPNPDLEFPQESGVFELRKLSKVLIGMGVANMIAAVLF